nr:Mrp/NBP35 family ATP-binding protein [Acanthopleuribacter pedis]
MGEAALRAAVEARVRTFTTKPPRLSFSQTVKAVPVPGKQKIPGVANLIAIASGKGGVGKSTVTVNTAMALQQAGARVGILDCDLYGPSVPAMFGVEEQMVANREKKLVPVDVYGIKMVSMGFLMARHQALSWRGPMLHKMLSQFLFGVDWGTLDYLLLDLPPGTGDVQLSLTQLAPMAGAALVTTPQKVALRDVMRGLEMFKDVGVPVLGLVENMSYYACPCCDERTYVFGRDGGKRLAKRYEIPFLGEVPMSRRVPSALGSGEPLMLRAQTDAAEPGVATLAAAFRDVSARLIGRLVVAEPRFAVGGPDAMEV